MNSEFARGLPSAISNLRKASARSDSVAARGRVWTGTLSLFFPDETSSVEDRVDEGGESSDLVGEILPRPSGLAALSTLLQNSSERFSRDL